MSTRCLKIFSSLCPAVVLHVVVVVLSNLLSDLISTSSHNILDPVYTSSIRYLVEFKLLHLFVQKTRISRREKRLHLQPKTRTPVTPPAWRYGCTTVLFCPPPNFSSFCPQLHWKHFRRVASSGAEHEKLSTRIGVRC